MEFISRELCSSVLPVLIPTENQRHEHGSMRECFVLNHETSVIQEATTEGLFITGAPLISSSFTCAGLMSGLVQIQSAKGGLQL